MSFTSDRRAPDNGLARQHNNSSPFVKQAEGTVTVRAAATRTAVACAPRCALTRDGEIVCTFIVQSATGINDFLPMLARSRDGGVTWQEEGLVWRHLQNRYSLFGSVSGTPQRELFYYGISTPIDSPGETFWCEATQGMKQNGLVWARSLDGGRSWSEPEPIPLATLGSAEAPGAMCVTRAGTWHASYAPYNTFDPTLRVPRNQVVLMSSDDEGTSWRSTAMLRFDDELSTAAEAWVVELADGRLLGACWNLNQRDGSDFPNAYAVSEDGGKAWSPTRSTGIMGQACALAPLPDGSALFVYNQRKHGRIGVWLAVVKPTGRTFNVLSNEIVWEAGGAPSNNGHSQWTQFTFGEPSVLLLDDGSLLVSFWTMDQGGGAIRYVKLAARKDVPAPLGLRF